ncbi:long-chain fatty acid--CoA ligase [Haloarcula salinisoli]|uniref:Long-chain fatty acid--CoA ligase n=1 Tax=Haloarcula salinisoli TaxID=2487746 RepID=A0A8J7YHG3_9EURY|nr:long-chain fatty acid--CoA ligase [Halomicroarcula salinisoli]MBX0288600.1 long-chain fatty acid--CoA ligase [Halomicroarcula salinisoli]MBX0306020.1 long-chain fatty acid--CoA ligase [Halomicroarcula salinisoli]
MNVCRKFDRFATGNDDVAIRTPGRDDKSYQQLRRESGYVAGLLRENGIGPSDRVILHLPNDSAYVSVLLGIWRVGAVGVPMDERWGGEVASHVLADIEPSLVVTTDQYAMRLREQISGDPLAEIPVAKIDTAAVGDLGITEVSEPSMTVEPQMDDDIAKVVYTSGTTGTPKGVIHTHRNITAVVEMAANVFDLSDDDIFLASVPLCRSPGIYGSALPALCVGGSVVLQAEWDPQWWSELIAEYEPRLNLLKPQQMRETIEVDDEAVSDTSSLEICMVTTGLLRSKSTFTDFEATYDVDNVINYYGQTESLAVSMGTLSADTQPNYIGQPADVLETKLVDPSTGRELPPGNDGELLLRGDVVTPGYWNRHITASELFTDGWLRTEDRIQQDEDGNFYFLERLST